MAFEVGEFSPVRERHFSQLLEKKEVFVSDAEIAAVKEHLKRDANQKLMRQLLKRM
jgi:hypothetical protein